MSTVLLKDQQIEVPCGKCPACRKRRVSAWSHRLMQEDKVSTSAHFITLTYDTTHVPISRNGFMSCKKSDVQKFMKRLRKADINATRTIKYYLCSEYGGKTKRPHYHAIIFNCTDVYLIESTWQLGTVHYGQVTGASVGYTLKYMDKPKKIPAHRNDDREPEFGLMSKGLGLSYINEQSIKWHKQDAINRMYIPIEDGKKISMCRYYKSKIYEETERQIIGKIQRERLLEQQAKEILNKGLDQYNHDKNAYHYAEVRKFISNSKKDKL